MLSFIRFDDIDYSFQSLSREARNGRQEHDDEVKGEGNSINYTYRMHDPRIGRFFAMDPLSDKYPFYSPYAFSGNRVLDAIELEGLEPFSHLADLEARNGTRFVVLDGDIVQKSINQTQQSLFDFAMNKIKQQRLSRPPINTPTNTEGFTSLYHISNSTAGAKRTAIVRYTEAQFVTLPYPRGLNSVLINGATYLQSGNQIYSGIVDVDLYDWDTRPFGALPWIWPSVFTPFSIIIGRPASTPTASGFTLFTSQNGAIEFNRIPGTFNIPGTTSSFSVDLLQTPGIKNYGQNITDALVPDGSGGFTSVKITNTNRPGDYANMRGAYEYEQSMLPSSPSDGDTISFSYSGGQKTQRIYTFSSASGWNAVETNNSGNVRISIKGK